MGTACTGMAPVPRRLAALVAALALRGAGALQELSYCGPDGACKELYPREDAPVRLCPAPEVRPPLPLRPFTQVRFRLVLGTPESEGSARWWQVGSSRRSAPKLRYTARPRGFCEWFGVSPMLVCPSCADEPCSLPVREAWGRPSTFEALLPPYGGCVHVGKLPEGVSQAEARWDVYLDPLVPVCIVAGFVLVWYWVPLRESIALHAVLGGTASLAFVATVVALWLFRSVRGTFEGTVPFGRTLASLSMVLLAFVPAARDALISLVVPENWYDVQSWLYWEDPVYNLPVGWIAAAAATLLSVATVSLGANISMRYFASPPEVTGDVDFTIGSDGRRIDILPPTPWPQRLLGWLLWLLGIWLLLVSTHSDAFSALLLAAALLANWLQHAGGALLLRARRGPSPGQLRPLISTDMFKEQGTHYTEAAVAQLRVALQAQPFLLRRVREESELRLRRFSEGSTHFQPPPDALEEERGRRCAIM